MKLRTKLLFIKHKYEFLLFALIQHLFIGVLLSDLENYTKIIWPINTLILGIASVGVFIERREKKYIFTTILFLAMLLLPISLPFLEKKAILMEILSIIYMLFFVLIFWEVIKFLIKPSYINIDIIIASACGFFLMIEISTFLMLYIYYTNPQSFNDLDTSSPVSLFMDLVYYSSILQTTIGFGDITPNTHTTKLLSSFLGIIGQFYSVVLVGILITKFSGNLNLYKKNNEQKNKI